MGRAPCCPKDAALNRGAWTAEEDTILSEYVRIHGHDGWRSLPPKAGLSRCGKSCRLRWLNYLRPDIKRGNISPDEEDLIIKLHRLLGNRWSLIAARLPGRTDNEIKNHWNTYLRKRASQSQTPTKSRKSLTKSTGPPVGARLFKPTPVRLAKDCTKNAIPGDSDPQRLTLAVNTAKNLEEWTDLLADELMTNDYSEFLDFTSELESLSGESSLHSPSFKLNLANLHTDEHSLSAYLSHWKELSSRECGLNSDLVFL